MEHKTRIPWPDLDTGEAIYHWLIANVGPDEVDWRLKPNNWWPPRNIKNFNLEFKREEDKIKFILKWC